MNGHWKRLIYVRILTQRVEIHMGVLDEYQIVYPDLLFCIMFLEKNGSAAGKEKDRTWPTQDREGMEMDKWYHTHHYINGINYSSDPQPFRLGRSVRGKEDGSVQVAGAYVSMHNFICTSDGCMHPPFKQMEFYVWVWMSTTHWLRLAMLLFWLRQDRYYFRRPWKKIY